MLAVLCCNLLPYHTSISYFHIILLYHNMSHLKTPQCLEFVLPNTSNGNIHYAMRNPRLQLPIHFHEVIKTTGRYQLPTHLSNLNAEP